jgi:hypothetical protein
MKPNRIISAMSVFATMVALCAALPELSEGNKSKVTQSDPLLSWNEGWRLQSTEGFGDLLGSDFGRPEFPGKVPAPRNTIRRSRSYSFAILPPNVAMRHYDVLPRPLPNLPTGVVKRARTGV